MHDINQTIHLHQVVLAVHWIESTMTAHRMMQLPCAFYQNLNFVIIGH